MQSAMDELGIAWLKLRSCVDDLASEHRHYLDFFERAVDAYLVTDPLGVIVEMNGAAVDLLERRRYYLRGKPLAALVTPDQRGEFRSRLRGLSRPASWRSAVAVRGEPHAVEFSARRIPGQGICWRLQSLQ